MTKSKGFNSRTRRLLKRKPRESGIRPPNYLLTDYEDGQRVNVILDSRFASGRPHRRYHGKTGLVVGRQGRSYIVNLTIGQMKKRLIIMPEHLTLSK